MVRRRVQRVGCLGTRHLRECPYRQSSDGGAARGGGGAGGHGGVPRVARCAAERVRLAIHRHVFSPFKFDPPCATCKLRDISADGSCLLLHVLMSDNRAIKMRVAELGGCSAVLRVCLPVVSPALFSHLAPLPLPKRGLHLILPHPSLPYPPPPTYIPTRYSSLQALAATGACEGVMRASLLALLALSVVQDIRAV